MKTRMTQSLYDMFQEISLKFGVFLNLFCTNLIKKNFFKRRKFFVQAAQYNKRIILKWLCVTLPFVYKVSVHYKKLFLYEYEEGSATWDFDLCYPKNILG